MKPAVDRRPRGLRGRRLYAALSVAVVLSTYTLVYFTSSWKIAFSDRLDAFSAASGFRADSTAAAAPPRGFALVESAGKDRRRTRAAAHCTSSTMTDVAHLTSACFYKNLCYHPKTDAFVLHEGWSSTKDAETVALSGACSSDPPSKAELPFTPILSEQAVPYPHYEPLSATPNEDVYVLYAESACCRDARCGESMALREDLFSWFLLFANSPWGAHEFLGGNKQAWRFVKPVLLGSTLSTKEEADELGRWSPWVASVLNGTLGRPLIPKLDFPKDAPTCFPRSGAGTGSFTDRCISPRGFEPSRKSPVNGVHYNDLPCSAGRGPLYWRLRGVLADAAGLVLPDQIDPASPLIVVSVSGTQPEVEIALTRVIEELKREKVPVEVLRGSWSMREKMRLAGRAAVFVAGSDDASLYAMFVPRQATIVLVEPLRVKPLRGYSLEPNPAVALDRKTEKMRGGELYNWGFFSSLGYAEVKYMVVDAQSDWVVPPSYMEMPAIDSLTSLVRSLVNNACRRVP